MFQNANEGPVSMICDMNKMGVILNFSWQVLHLDRFADNCADVVIFENDNSNNHNDSCCPHIVVVRLQPRSFTNYLRENHFDPPPCESFYWMKVKISIE